jgi:hypothetical protein
VPQGQAICQVGPFMMAFNVRADPAQVRQPRTRLSGHDAVDRLLERQRIARFVHQALDEGIAPSPGARLARTSSAP